MSTLYLVFRIICYGALIMVAGGIVGMIVLSNPEVCSSFSTGAISCNTPEIEELAKLTMGILLVSAFTGVPVLLALGGLFFAVRAVAPKIAAFYRKFRGTPKAPQAPPEQQTVLKKLAKAGKIMAYIVAAFFVSAIIAGIYEASMQ